MILSSGGSKSKSKSKKSSSKKPSYPKPSKGIVGITKKKTPIKSKAKPKAKPKTSYKGGGNTGKLDKFVKAVKKDVKKAVNWAKKPGHLVPSGIHKAPTTGFTDKKAPTKKKVVAKKPAPKKVVAKKPVTKPTSIRKAPVLPKPKTPVPSKASAYDKYKAITKAAAAKSKGTKPAPHKSNALGQAGLDPKKYTNKDNSLGQAGLDAKKYTNAVKKPTNVPVKPVTSSAPKTGTYTPPRPSSVTTSKAPVTSTGSTKAPVTTTATKAPTTTTTAPAATATKTPTTTSTAPTTPTSSMTSTPMDPYTAQQMQLEKDRQAALNAQDVALNKGLGTQQASNFQQFQSLQQDMVNRGMANSGIAADAYMRANMGANANYQQAYSDAATKKSEIQSQYDSNISQSRIDQQAYKDSRQAYADQLAAAQAKAATDQQSAQTEQDKYLTSATGYVYVGGERLMIGGKPVTSMEWNKLTETQRHNMATEANTATANAQDYALGMDKNAISREKIANDLQIAINRSQLDYAKLDYNYTKLESDNAYNQDKLQIAIANAQTSKDKTQLTALGKQADGFAKQIAAYQKAGKKPPKSLVDKYNKTNKAISGIVGGTSFKTSGGGGDISKAPSGTPSAFGGYRRVNQAPAAFNNQMTQAISKGVPFAQAKLLTELIGRESGFRATAKNPTSTAYGYGQFLTSTRNAYAKKYPQYNYNNPVDQIVLTWKYVQDRYGSAQKALEMWEKRSPHWY
jgi:hypothetical protein